VNASISVEDRKDPTLAKAIERTEKFVESHGKDR
jgi:hypothetical protein